MKPLLILFFLALPALARQATKVGSERWYQEKIAAADRADALRLGSIIAKDQLPITLRLWPDDFSKKPA